MRFLASIVVVAMTASGACTLRRPAEPPMRTVPLVFVALSDDDGEGGVRVERGRLADWVRFTNAVFGSAGIRFELDPDSGVIGRRATSLNRIANGREETWASTKAIGNAVAAEYPGSVVVLLRRGPGEVPWGRGFSATDLAFVVGAGTEDTEHCGKRHDDFLAHEIGHYLGLSHTFAGDPFPSIGAAEAHFVARGREPAVFDGDGLPDTPPDPAIRALECRPDGRVVLGGVTFPLPRRNVMSYYEEKDRLTPQQRRIARWVLDRRLASPGSMRFPVNTPVRDPVEAEEMRVESADGVRTGVQPMRAFGIGDWSGDAQLFAQATGAGGEVTLVFEVPSRLERLVLHATRAPDFVRLEVLVDGAVASHPIDLWAPVVVPSGPIALEQGGRPLGLEPGEHRLTVRVIGRNEASRGWAFGLDAIGAGSR